AAFEILRGRERDRVHKQVETAAESVGSLREDTCDVVVGAYVAFRDVLGVDGLGEFAHGALDPLALVGERQLGALVVQPLPDRPRDRALVRHAEHQCLLALEPPRHRVDPIRIGCGAVKVAVVTGASSGIGEATARALAARDWHCVLVARREDRLRALADEIGGEVEVCDVGERAAVEAMAERVRERHHTVDLLVNNAGMPARETFLDADLDLVERVLAVNYLGGVWCTRALLPALKRSRAAHVVNVVSVAGAIAFARSGPYVASKHAQLAFSRCLRPTLSRHRIKVHTVLPGFVQTEGFSQRALQRQRRSRWLVT